MSGAEWNDDDRAVLFAVLFDIRALLSRLIEFVEGGDDGEEEAEEEEDPDVP
jgi:hypothetical protein